MVAAKGLQVQSEQSDPDVTTRVGRWLFRHRTALPIPVAIAILALRSGDGAPSLMLVGAGVAVTLFGEWIRLWGVHHIGVISRTRSDRLGPLIASGPFAHLRNPLYVGNILLWVGFALSARLVWLAPVIGILLGAEYHAIVRWEERLLESRFGDAYRTYAARVPRWLPSLNRGKMINRGERGARKDQDFSAISASSEVESGFLWRETFFSERGTLLAIAAGYLLLWIKAHF